MASPPLSLAVDNYDDDFDWEAAVREIDSACQNATASTSNLPATPALDACPQPAKIKGKGRQSTLDRFVGSFEKRKNENDGRQRSWVCEASAVDRGGIDDSGAGDEVPAVGIDLEAAQTWIYPVNVPLRDYQFSIARSSLFSNTLVALPTGLGKTLIAAVVMYNYFRWFPEGKVVFTAPSRPLVMQQIEACHNIVGIPQEWAIDMTGQMSPVKRSSFWKTKRVFFVTPQVLEKDIQSGICLVKQLVCLVIDEAHRACGNYSYCVVIRELMAVPVQLRILGLTATPGSKQQTIQNVIDNLCISTLEYRTETDHDVSPYVHNRKLELIQVAMGKDAIGVTDLLLEAIKPFATRLCSMGVLYNRDLATFSPCELLNSRDKFRQAPPLSLPHSKYGEVEGYFGVLITLYHIRKLLSSHGIRPAYEMLDEKLRQGSFGRLMARNETIWKAKLLMQKSLSHGAPNPKLEKMIEILVDHFKMKNPKDSRVIIFSNFRGSVRDIMNSLSSIGDIVKATEFIGQSSGKSLKGQSQKVQQAVLQKFRTGGYNVIVATSIGEEGLDIMEVDLVICFDANISPLRMIQRMGRTGRKHDGRVVVLACEGSEIKGYQKKLASSKAVRKHMHNGGIKSFNFHSSPRMVPHICKPQVQFVEMSIEQFIPRGKKAKDDTVHRSPFSKKILDAEKEIIARYFHQHEGNIWKPSLIAFPGFQAFPSRVYEVQHSFRTTQMLINTMQHLQGLALSKDKVETSNQSFKGATAVLDDNKQDSKYVHRALHDVSEAVFRGEKFDTKVSLSETPDSKDGLKMPDDLSQKPSHCFLFGEDFVTLKSLVSVCITTVPSLPYKGYVAKDVPVDDHKELLISTMYDAYSLKASAANNSNMAMQLDDSPEVEMSTKQKHSRTQGILASQSPNYGSQNDERGEKFVHTPVSKEKLTNPKVCAAEARRSTEKVSCSLLACESSGTLKDMELSPRLSHFIEEGIVPESPLVKINHFCETENMVCASLTPSYDKYGSQTKCQSTNLHAKKNLFDVESCSAMLLDIPGNKSHLSCYATPNITKISGQSSTKVANTDKHELAKVQNNLHESRTKRNMLDSPINEDVCTPLANAMNNSSSENWDPNSGEASKSSLPAPKYKRLRRYGDMDKNLPCQTLEKKYDCSLTQLNQVDHRKGQMKRTKKHINSFIEEEAEVSDDAEVSEDEEDNENEDKYDDSFIDDRTNPTEGNTQGKNSGDMMAFYRRSLLTQSPAECLQNSLVTSYESFSSRAAETESGSCSSQKVYGAHQSTGRSSVACQSTLVDEASSSPGKCSKQLESRKRKLSFQHAGSIPETKFQLEHVSEIEHEGKASLHQQPGSSSMNADLFCDDDFFQDLDLDAVEEQATKILKYKSGLSAEQMPTSTTNHYADSKEDATMAFLNNPSFDLGFEC